MEHTHTHAHEKRAFVTFNVSSFIFNHTF